MLANLGVIAKIVFLGLEIRQNTAALEREIEIGNADLQGRIAESDYLPEILEKVHEVQGPDVMETVYMEEFGLSNQEAQRLWRFLFQLWIRTQADWRYNGADPNDCRQGKTQLQYLDNRMLFSNMKSSLDPEFVQCVESADVAN